MIAFEILVNGKRVCVAGTSRVTSVGINWVSRNPGDILFDVSGIDPNDRGETHVEWPVPSIGIGDEVAIRVVSVDSVDEPLRKPPA